MRMTALAGALPILAAAAPVVAATPEPKFAFPSPLDMHFDSAPPATGLPSTRSARVLAAYRQEIAAIRAGK